MTVLKPKFYNDFKCIGSKCRDNCCIGWEVDIDSQTLEKYNSLNNGFGEKIRSKITVSEDSSSCIKLGDNGRCPFLNMDNLCEIIINCGEDAICDICKEHPRFYNIFPSVTEIGLGLACEEVCRLFLENDFQIQSTETEIQENLNEEEKNEMLIYNKISYLRGKIFDIMKEEKDYSEKVEDVISYLEDETEEMSFVKTDKELVSDYKMCEPIDDSWSGFILSLSENLTDIMEFEKTVNVTEEENKLYSKLFCYILFRHLSQGVFDGEIMCRVCFAVESVRFIMLSDLYTKEKYGEITVNDRINNIKRWSKQVEYSEENTEFLIFGEF